MCEGGGGGGGGGKEHKRIAKVEWRRGCSRTIWGLPPNGWAPAEIYLLSANHLALLERRMVAAQELVLIQYTVYRQIMVYAMASISITQSKDVLLLQGVTKKCCLSWLTNSAIVYVYEPKCGGMGGVAGSQPMRSNSIFNLCTLLLLLSIQAGRWLRDVVYLGCTKTLVRII